MARLYETELLRKSLDDFLGGKLIFNRSSDDTQCWSISCKGTFNSDEEPALHIAYGPSNAEKDILVIKYRDEELEREIFDGPNFFLTDEEIEQNDQQKTIANAGNGKVVEINSNMEINKLVAAPNAPTSIGTYTVPTGLNLGIKAGNAIFEKGIDRYPFFYSYSSKNSFDNLLIYADSDKWYSKDFIFEYSEKNIDVYLEDCTGDPTIDDTEVQLATTEYVKNNTTRSVYFVTSNAIIQTNTGTLSSLSNFQYDLSSIIPEGTTHVMLEISINAHRSYAQNWVEVYNPYNNVWYTWVFHKRHANDGVGGGSFKGIFPVKENRILDIRWRADYYFAGYAKINIQEIRVTGYIK